ncbi:MAG: PTS sugar transporter subunit IIB [Chloroflexi bacterium]|nr:PTS sugar transporter subunit IIB [Chloroflexota bacterium]
MGLGSGLLVRMGIERALKKAGISENDFNVEVADISTAKAVWPDIFVTSTEFATRLRELDTPVVEIFNLFDEKEIGEKLLPVFKQIAEKKGE